MQKFVWWKLCFIQTQRSKMMQILPRMSICLQIHRYVLINNWKVIIDLPTEDTVLGAVNFSAFYFDRSLLASWWWDKIYKSRYKHRENVFWRKWVHCHPAIDLPRPPCTIKGCRASPLTWAISSSLWRQGVRFLLSLC